MPDRTAPPLPPLPETIPGGGEVGALLRARDASPTPLGPPQAWPHSLRTAVRILLSSRFSMWMGWGPDLTFLYNDAYARDTLGRKHPWALGRPAREVWAEIWEDIGPRIRTVLATGEATWDEALLLFLERSGYREETYHTFSYSPLMDDEGRTSGMFCVVMEETERVIGERRLATLRELAADLARTTREDGVLATVQRHVGANPKDLPFTLLYLAEPGSGRARLACRTGIDASHPAAPGALERDGADPVWPVDALAGHRAPILVEDVGGRFADLPTGAWDAPPAQAVVVPLARQGQEETAGVLVVGLNPYRPFDGAYAGFVDLVAGQIAASLASARAHEEERRRAEALAELDRAKTAFFSNISHEFRTPLTLIAAPAEDALADPALPPAERARWETVHRSGLRLQKLVNTLLDFSRIEAGRVEALFEPVELGAFTRDLASLFRSAMERAGLRLVIDTPALPAPAYVDRDLWEKIVLNLLSNAFKHTFRGEVAVTLRGTGPSIELRVRDTGIGIASEQLPHVFDRFHRIRGARSRTHEGTGIGLALVKELVALHGGTIEVGSVVGEGTTFTVRIPAGAAHLPPEQIAGARPHEGGARHASAFVEEALRWVPDGPVAVHDPPAGGHGPAPAPAPAAEEVPTHRARVLLADDNADMRDYLRRLLGVRWEIEAVPDGAAALAAALLRPPDLVLSDVMMPGLDGFELLQALRADPRTREIPVVLLSARAGEEARIEGARAGADDYLAKPFSARELVAKVAGHLALARVRREAAGRLRRANRKLRRAVAARRESEARFRNMAEHAPVMLWVTDASGACTYLNRQWYAFTGQTEETGLGFGWLEAIHPGDRPHAEEVFLAANARREGFRLEYRLRRRDGAYRWAIDSAAPRSGASGAFLGYVGSVIDIDERKAAEEQREQLLEEAEGARRLADEANRAKSEFLASMSHELRTPLNAIAGYVELLALGIHGAVTEEQRSAFQRIRRNQAVLLSLINDVLNFAKLEAGKLEVARAAVPVRETLQGLEPLVAPQVRARELAYACEPCDGALAVLGDPERIQQILINLLTNAVKFTDRRGRITLRAEAASDRVRIHVSDTGRGIPADRLESIFDPFVQVDRRAALVDSSQQGVGLGLAISRELARAMDGSLEVESTVGRGTTFTLTLPRAGNIPAQP